MLEFFIFGEKNFMFIPINRHENEKEGLFEGPSRCPMQCSVFYCGDAVNTRMTVNCRN